MCSGYSRARIVRANLLVLHGLADASLAAIARKLKAARAFSVQVLTSILRGGNYVLMRKLCVLNTLLNETDVVIPNTLLSLGLSLAVSFKKNQPLTEFETRQMYCSLPHNLQGT